MSLTRYEPRLVSLADLLGGAAGDPTSPDAWCPILVRLGPGERAELEGWSAGHCVRVIDTFERQLDDLAVIRHPAAEPATRRAWRDAVVDGEGGGEALGTWVLLPWERRAVRLLDADDFHALVTDRNRDKITRDEQARLRTRTIGVVGLSVGGEIAATLAQENLCGTLVLSDFDRLDVSNLNRLAAGVADLGLPKTTLVARRILTLNPYLTVEIHPDGVSTGNADAFLGGLDLLVEECDGLAMKPLLREEARRRRLDVVFAADERGFLSVEPYGRHPEGEIFHGLLRRPQLPRESYPSALEHMKALAEWMGGWERISERSRASLERLGRELSGYPQLAGEARLAAAQVAHVARRLLLGEPLPMWWGHLDLDELVGRGEPAAG